MLEVQANKAKSLRNKLERFIEKQDYRHRQNVTSDEAKAGRVAMEFLNGKPGPLAARSSANLQGRGPVARVDKSKILV